MKAIKLNSGQNPLNGHRLIRTPHYYGKLALSLGKKVLTSVLSKFNPDTPLIRALSAIAPSVALSFRINGDWLLSLFHISGWPSYLRRSRRYSTWDGCSIMSTGKTLATDTIPFQSLPQACLWSWVEFNFTGMLASYTAGVYRNAGGQECRVMRFCGGKDLRGSCCKCNGDAALVAIWPVGQPGICIGARYYFSLRSR